MQLLIPFYESNKVWEGVCYQFSDAVNIIYFYQFCIYGGNMEVYNRKVPYTVLHKIITENIKLKTISFLNLMVLKVLPLDILA